MIKLYRPYGIGCTECNVRLIAPICSEYVTERHVRHSWSCENCGHQFVTSDRLQLTSPSKVRHGCLSRARRHLWPNCCLAPAPQRRSALTIGGDKPQARWISVHSRSAANAPQTTRDQP